MQTQASFSLISVVRLQLAQMSRSGDFYANYRQQQYDHFTLCTCTLGDSYTQAQQITKYVRADL